MEINTHVKMLLKTSRQGGNEIKKGMLFIRIKYLGKQPLRGKGMS